MIVLGLKNGDFQKYIMQGGKENYPPPSFYPFINRFDALFYVRKIRPAIEI